MASFANIFTNELYSTKRYQMTSLGTKLTTFSKQNRRKYHSEVLGHSTLVMVNHYVNLASAHKTIQHQKYSPMDRTQEKERES